MKYFTLFFLILLCSSLFSMERENSDLFKISSVLHAYLAFLRCDYSESQLIDEIKKANQNDLNIVLMSACAHNDTRTAKILIAHGAKANYEDEYGDTPLHTACLKGNSDLVKFLHANGADINAAAKNGLEVTPLFIACRQWSFVKQRAQSENFFNCVKYLLEQGADIEHQTAGWPKALDVIKDSQFQQLIDRQVITITETKKLDEQVVNYVFIVNENKH